MRESKPSTEDLAAAELHLDDEQMAASQTREKYYRQEYPFPYFLANIDDASYDRRPPTEDEKEKMDDRLIALGELFNGSDIKWQLDGAMNISLYAGEYIGVHKDVDISLEADDLEKLEGLLDAKGYGLFIPSYEHGQRDSTLVYRRAGRDEFKGSQLSIASINAEGKVTNDKALYNLDVHILDRDPAGHAMFGGMLPYPAEWAKPTPVEFSGQTINCSHPARVILYKLAWARNYDMSDIKKLLATGLVSRHDINEIEKIYTHVADSNKDIARQIMSKIQPDFHPGMTEDDIFNVFATNPVFKMALFPMHQEKLKGISVKLAVTQNFSLDSLTDTAMEEFGIYRFQNRIAEMKNLLPQ